MRKKMLGEEHPDVAQSLNNLASLYKDKILSSRQYHCMDNCMGLSLVIKVLLLCLEICS